MLGSHFDQWGVVVHEAASCGCMLVLSSHVGSRYDFAGEDNAVLFDPDSVTEFERALEDVVCRSKGELERGQKQSVELSERFSPAIFAKNLTRMVASPRK